MSAIGAVALTLRGAPVFPSVSMACALGWRVYVVSDGNAGGHGQLIVLPPYLSRLLPYLFIIPEVSSTFWPLGVYLQPWPAVDCRFRL